MSNYGERAYGDLVKLGLASSSHEQDWWTQYGVHTLTSYSRRINNPSLPSKSINTLQTSFGKRVKAVQAMGIMFDDDTSQACRAAERHLVTNLDPETLNDRRLPSPIVIMAGKVACGVIKSFGDPTCYGLQDIPDLNLVRGAWHDVVGDNTLNDEFMGDTAFTVPLDTVDTFKPIRLSHFTIPVNERRSLEVVGRHPLAYTLVSQTGEKAIDHLVAEAMKDAVSLPLPVN